MLGRAAIAAASPPRSMNAGTYRDPATAITASPPQQRSVLPSERGGAGRFWAAASNTSAISPISRQWSPGAAENATHHQSPPGLGNAALNPPSPHRSQALHRATPTSPTSPASVTSVSGASQPSVARFLQRKSLSLCRDLFEGLLSVNSQAANPEDPPMTLSAAISIVIAELQRYSTWYRLTTPIAALYVNPNGTIASVAYAPLCVSHLSDFVDNVALLVFELHASARGAPQSSTQSSLSSPDQYYPGASTSWSLVRGASASTIANHVSPLFDLTLGEVTRALLGTRTGNFSGVCGASGGAPSEGSWLHAANGGLTFLSVAHHPDAQAAVLEVGAECRSAFDRLGRGGADKLPLAALLGALSSSAGERAQWLLGIWKTPHGCAVLSSFSRAAVGMLVFSEFQTALLWIAWRYASETASTTATARTSFSDAAATVGRSYKEWVADLA